MDISARFDRYLKNISPNPRQIKEVNQRVATLKKELKAHIENEGKFHVGHILRSGSSVKHTDLALPNKHTFDIDLGVYFRAQGELEEQGERLRKYIHACVSRFYPPNKSPKDFYPGRNAVTVELHGRPLTIDIVPIIRCASPIVKYRNTGYIPREDGLRLTSISAHVDFVLNRTEVSQANPRRVPFNKLVRLMKVWHKQLENPLHRNSHFCELITASVFDFDEREVTNQWQSSLLNIFSFIEKHAFNEPIIFDDYYQLKDVKPCNDPVVVLDAVDPANNVARKWTLETKRGYLKEVRRTVARIREAQEWEKKGNEEEAVKKWCQIFGSDFRRLSNG